MSAYDTGTYDRGVRYFETDPRQMPLGQLLTWVGHQLGEHWRKTTSGAGVSRTSLTLLMAIADNDGMTQREIARHSQLSPATLTPAVDALETDGLLDRERDAKDRRQVRLHITDRGRSRLDEALAVVRAEFGSLFPEISEHDSQLIRNFLVTLFDRLHEKKDDDERRG